MPCLPDISQRRTDGQFYLGFCNATIWPLFHYFTSYTVYQPRFWEEYKQINNLFADALKAVLRPDDIVWVHDYHLMLLPRLLKARHSQLSVGFFSTFLFHLSRYFGCCRQSGVAAFSRGFWAPI